MKKQVRETGIERTGRRLEENLEGSLRRRQQLFVVVLSLVISEAQ